MMTITKKHQYGLMAMFELGSLLNQGPVQLKLIAQSADIPHAFLEQLILSLKRAGLVKSTRGAKGGYELAQPANVISIQSIFSAIDPVHVPSNHTDSLSFFWTKLNHHVDQFFNMSLQTLIDDSRNNRQVLSYTI